MLQLYDMASVWPVDQDIIVRSQQWLMGLRDGAGGYDTTKSTKSFRVDQKIIDAYITYSLLRSGAIGIDKELDVQLQQAKQSKDPYHLALVALSLSYTERTREASEAARRLVTLQHEDGFGDQQQKR